MGRLFPEYRIVEITGGDDEVLHVLYDVDQLTQIPGARHLELPPRLVWAFRWACPSRTGAESTTIKGRCSSPSNFNQDVGDAWEHADDRVLPGADDRARIPLRHQLHHLRDDALRSGSDGTVDLTRCLTRDLHQRAKFGLKSTAIAAS